MNLKSPIMLNPAASVLTGILLTTFLAGSNSALGEDAKPADLSKKLWDSVASADLTLTRGNSRSFLATTTLSTQRKWTMDEPLLGGGAGFGNTTAKSSNGQDSKISINSRGQMRVRSYSLNCMMGDNLGTAGDVHPGITENRKFSGVRNPGPSAGSFFFDE